MSGQQLSGKRLIGVAIDGSKQAEAAFNYALDIIYKEGTDAIVLIHCCDFHVSIGLHAMDCLYKEGRDFIVLIHCSEYNVSTGMPGAFSKVDEICAQMKKKEDEISSLISKYTQILREKGIPGRVCKCGGKPGEEIIKACKTENISQLVMGTRGLGAIRRTFLGSVSEYCVHHTDIPITIVPVN